MIQHSFKELLQNDANTVFLNPAEFGESHCIDGRTMTVIIDNNEMLEREQRYKIIDDGMFTCQQLIYVLAEEYGPLPKINKTVVLDGKTYRVADAIEEDGIYSLLLEANRS